MITDAWTTSKAGQFPSIIDLWKILSPQQTFLNMNDQTTSPNGVTKSTTASSGNQGAVAQLDDTGRGMSGNIPHLKGCLWKNNNNKSCSAISIFDIKLVTTIDLVTIFQRSFFNLLHKIIRLVTLCNLVTQI